MTDSYPYQELRTYGTSDAQNGVGEDEHAFGLPFDRKEHALSSRARVVYIITCLLLLTLFVTDSAYWTWVTVALGAEAGAEITRMVLTVVIQTVTLLQPAAGTVLALHHLLANDLVSGLRPSVTLQHAIASFTGQTIWRRSVPLGIQPSHASQPSPCRRPHANQLMAAVCFAGYLASLTPAVFMRKDSNVFNEFPDSHVFDFPGGDHLKAYAGFSNVVVSLLQVLVMFVWTTGVANYLADHDTQLRSMYMNNTVSCLELTSMLCESEINHANGIALQPVLLPDLLRQRYIMHKRGETVLQKCETDIIVVMAFALVTFLLSIVYSLLVAIRGGATTADLESMGWWGVFALFMFLPGAVLMAYRAANLRDTSRNERNRVASRIILRINDVKSVTPVQLAEATQALNTMVLLSQEQPLVEFNLLAKWRVSGGAFITLVLLIAAWITIRMLQVGPEVSK